MNTKRSDPYSIQRLRNNLCHFGIGKFVNGCLGLFILHLLAGGLSIPEYAIYVLFIAITKISTSFSSVGLETIALIYIPQYRANRRIHELLAFIFSLISLRMFLLILCVGLIWFGSPFLGDYFSFGQWVPLLQVYAWIIFLEGLANYWQIIFGSLLSQGVAQRNWLLRNLLFTTCLLTITYIWNTELTLKQVVFFELIATGTSALLGFLEMFWIWKKEGQHSWEYNSKWSPPSFQMMRKLALSNYFNQIFYKLGDHQTLLLVGARFLDTTTIAGLGFCLALYAQISRYLPGMMLWRVFQPKIIATFTARKNYTELQEKIMLLYKGSLLCLSALLIICVSFGENLLYLLSQGKYSDTFLLAIMLLVTLIPVNHRFLLSGLANILEQPRMIFWAAFAFLFALPLEYIFLLLEFGNLSISLALLLSSLLYNIILIYFLRNSGYHYHFDLIQVSKIGLITIATSAAAFPFVSSKLISSHIIINLMITGVLYLIFTWLLLPFTRRDIQALTRLLPPNIASRLKMKSEIVHSN